MLSTESAGTESAGTTDGVVEGPHARPDATPGPVIVVTGASRGLGAGLAGAFAAVGARLGLCARTTPVDPSGSALVAAVDVRDVEAVDAFTAAVAERFGQIDLWVNNAGVLEPIGPLADCDPSAVVRHIDTNVTGVLFGSRSFARHVRDRPGGGVLVNISSGAGVSPYAGWAVYCASKAAVDMITEVVSLEERAHGLSAYAVSPGVIDTDMQALIRSTPAAAFPSVDRFRSLHERQAFNTPVWVARFILDLFEERPVGDVRIRVPDQTP